MESPFTITVSTDSVRINDGRGETTITVTNTSSRALKARAEILPGRPEAGSWLAVSKNPERAFGAGGVEQFVVQVNVPKGSAEGEHTFKVRVADIADPNEHVTTGPPVGFKVAGPPAPPQPFPVWIFAVIGLVVFVLVGGGLAYWIATRPKAQTEGDRSNPPAETVEKAPPSEPKDANKTVTADNSPETTQGRAIADANPLVAAIRASEPDGPQRKGFDLGMGMWQGNLLDGPGKQAFAKSLAPAEQIGFADAATFSFQWNNNTVLAAKGAAIAMTDPAVAAARAKAHGATPTGLSVGLYWLGFDIATGIFGDPKLGAQGNTVIGTGSEKIRATLGRDGQEGFNDSLAFNVARRK